MDLLGLVRRSIGLSAVAAIVVAGCGSRGGEVGAPEVQDNGNGAAPDEPMPEFAAFNDGGGTLAEDMGGATFSGQADGPFESGTLTLTMSTDGVLTTFGGTLLGDFFGFPSGSEVVFDYQAETVTGTYVGPGGASEPLEDYLDQAGQFIHLTKVVVILVGDSFSAHTGYQTNLLPGQLTGPQAIEFDATLRAPDDDALQGAIGLPGHTDDQDPLFTLQRQ